MGIRFLQRVAGAGALAALVACGGTRSPGTTAPEPERPEPEPLPTHAPRNGLEVIGWMRKAHPSRELRSLTFDLNITNYAGDSTYVRQSRAFAALPGRLRVESLPMNNRSGFVRNRQRLAIFERGRRVSSSNRVDLTTLLAFDVFAQSIDTTIMWLDSAHVRFGQLKKDEIDGRDAWLVGGPDDDSTTARFWVDADAWRVVRVIQRDPSPPHAWIDTRFSDFTDTLNVPLPRRVQVFREGKLVEQQDYTNVTVNPALSSRRFNLNRW